MLSAFERSPWYKEEIAIKFQMGNNIRWHRLLSLRSNFIGSWRLYQKHETFFCYKKKQGVNKVRTASKLYAKMKKLLLSLTVRFKSVG